MFANLPDREDANRSATKAVPKRSYWALVIHSVWVVIWASRLYPPYPQLWDILHKAQAIGHWWVMFIPCYGKELSEVKCWSSNLKRLDRYFTTFRKTLELKFQAPWPMHCTLCLVWIDRLFPWPLRYFILKLTPLRHRRSLLDPKRGVARASDL